MRPGPLGMKAEALLQSAQFAWFARGLPLGVRARVLLAILTSILIVLGFAAALALHFAKVEEHAIAHRVQLAARNTAHAVDLEIAAAQALLSGLATSPSLQAGDLPALYEQLIRSQRPVGSRFMLYALDGAQLINTFHPFGAPLPGPRELLPNVEAIRTGQPQVSNLRFGRASNDYVIGVLMPVRRGADIAYVLAMSIPTPSLGRILDKLPEGGRHGRRWRRHVSSRTVPSAGMSASRSLRTSGPYPTRLTRPSAGHRPGWCPDGLGGGASRLALAGHGRTAKGGD